MATQAALVTELTDIASVETSESITSLLSGFVDKALAQHNSRLTYATLPVAEEELVLILAHMRVCLKRASLASKDGNTQATGFSTNRDTPYYKNIDLAAKLLEQYKMLSDGLGVNDRTEAVVQGTIRVRDMELNALVPLIESEGLGEILLSLATNTSTYFILNWRTDFSRNFLEYTIFHIEGGTATVFQEWNHDSAVGVPKISDVATKLQTLNSQTYTALKITDVNKAAINRFILVARTRSGTYSYSNELTIAAA